jgi:hypothetical protein
MPGKRKQKVDPRMQNQEIWEWKGGLVAKSRQEKLKNVEPEETDRESISTAFMSGWDVTQNWRLKREICRKAGVDPKYGTRPYLVKDIPTVTLVKIWNAAQEMGIFLL